MKKILILLMLGLVIMRTVTGCPTCLGRLELQSPTFFSEELYQLDPDDDVSSDNTYPGLPIRQATPDKDQSSEKEKVNENMSDKGGK
jgi:hypothetical protein